MTAPRCPECGAIIGLPEIAGDEHECDRKAAAERQAHARIAAKLRPALDRVRAGLPVPESEDDGPGTWDRRFFDRGDAS